MTNVDAAPLTIACEFLVYESLFFEKILWRMIKNYFAGWLFEPVNHLIHYFLVRGTHGIQLHYGPPRNEPVEFFTRYDEDEPLHAFVLLSLVNLFFFITV